MKRDQKNFFRVVRIALLIPLLVTAAADINAQVWTVLALGASGKDETHSGFARRVLSRDFDARTNYCETSDNLLHQ